MKKYYIYVTPEERNLIVESLVAKKNVRIAAGKYTDSVDDVLLKFYGQRRKKCV